METPNLLYLYQIIQENNNDLFWVVNADSLQFILISDSITELLGYSIDEMLSMSIRNIIPDDYYSEFEGILKKKISTSDNQGSKTFSLEMEFNDKNGIIIFVKVILIFIPDESGKPKEILFILKDIPNIQKLRKQLGKKDLTLKQDDEEFLAMNHKYFSIINKMEDTKRFILNSNEQLKESISADILLLAKLNDAQHTAKIGSWEWNIQTGNVWWSEELYNLLEVTPNKYKPYPESCEDFIHPDDKEIFRKQKSNSLDLGDSIDCDVRIFTSKGKLMICNFTGRILQERNGGARCFVGTMMDITSRKIAEESIKKMENVLKYIIIETSNKTEDEYFLAMVKALCLTLGADFAHIGVLLENKTHVKTLAMCNDQQILPNIEYNLKNEPCETVVGKLTCSYQKDVTSLFPEEFMLKEMKIEGYIGVPLFFKSGDPMGLIACLYKNPIENIPFTETVLNLFADRAVSEYERIIYQEQLVGAREKAEENDRLKTLFLQNMSHEIRTPMNAIVGFSELLEANVNNKNKISKFSNIIRKSSKDLLDLINDILNLSRIESGQQIIKEELFDLNMLLDELSNMFHIYKEKMGKSSIQLRFYHTSSPEDAKIFTDKGKLRQILINLINNAIKFTQKGKIEVGYTFILNNQIEFHVLDTGSGIPLNKQDLIFERFMQYTRATNKTKGGTGLGLAIAKGLIELLGGKIWVTSTVGKGSCFSFTINNKTPQKKETPPAKMEESKLKNFEHKIVLIVEDDKYSADYLKELLSDTNLVIHVAKNGKSAIRFLENNKADIVLMDISLPEMDGYEITRIIKGRWPYIKVVAQTAYAMQDDRNTALEAGCDDYLSKPLEKDSLLKVIDTQLS